MVAQAARAVDEAVEAAAGQDVDVGCAFEVALLVRVQAVAVARAVHATRVVGEGGRKAAGGGEIRLGRRIVYQPDPGRP